MNVSRYASSDWLHILWSFPRSTIMVNILSPVLVTTAWTCMIALLHRGLPHFVYKLLQACSGCVAGTSRPSTSGLRMPCRVLQATAPTPGRIAFLKGFSKQPHSIVGSAMSLLLVFRTNTAYTRFWEVTADLSTRLFARSFSVSLTVIFPQAQLSQHYTAPTLLKNKKHAPTKLRVLRRDGVVK